MDKKQGKLKILSEIHNAAKLYREHLVGKKFLYVFDNRFIEVIYKSENFRYLTGVATVLSAKSFYNYACRHMLNVSQIWFDAAHPYSLCVRKVSHIAQIPNLAGSESFMLKEICTNTQTYKFGTTGLNFTLCMNHEFDDAGNIKGDSFVAQSLRDEDCFSKSKKAFVVTHIFSKPNDSKKYTHLLYRDSKAQSLPADIIALLDESCLH